MPPVAAGGRRITTKEKYMFTTTNLTDNQVLVEGTDRRNYSDSQVVDSTQWESIKRHNLKNEALASIDEAIADLIAPIQEAVDAANAKLKLPELDPLLYFVEQEEVEGVPAQRPIMSRLNSDSVILRAIEEGHHDRLIWVNHRLVLTAAAAAAEPVPADADGVDIIS